MRQISFQGLRRLLGDQQPPCISLYMPTHRIGPDIQQGPVRLRNLLREAEQSLREKYPARDFRPVLKPLAALAEDEVFWSHRVDGLALFGSPNTFEIVETQRPLAEFVVVADSFHVKPLLRVLQSADRFHVLCVSRGQAKLYEGNRYALDEIELEGVPKTYTEAMMEQLTEIDPSDASAERGETFPTPQDPRLYHGGGGRDKVRDVLDVDVARFFRAVDRGILERYTQPSGLPLILAALSEHHHLFRQITRNNNLLPEGIQKDPFSMSADELRVEAWKIFSRHYQERLARLVDNFTGAQSRKVGSADLSDVAVAALGGRVHNLLVEAERHQPGKIDRTTGRVVDGQLAHPEVDDALDDLAELVLEQGGDVVVVPQDRMPTNSGLAATYRY